LFIFFKLFLYRRQRAIYIFLYFLYISPIILDYFYIIRINLFLINFPHFILFFFLFIYNHNKILKFHQNIKKIFILHQKKTTTIIKNYEIQIFITKTNLHLTNLNLFTPANKATPTINFKKQKYNFFFDYKIKYN
jgi:hypothetical protein